MSAHEQGYRSTSDEAWKRQPICTYCGQPWPCEVAAVEAERDAALQEVERLQVSLGTLTAVERDGQVQRDELVAEVASLQAALLDQAQARPHIHKWAPHLIEGINRPVKVVVRTDIEVVKVVWRRGEGCCGDDVVREITGIFDFSGHLLDEDDPCPTVLG